MVDTIFINDDTAGHANYGPVVIPAKGKTILLDTVNLAFYREVIENYEHNQLGLEGGTIKINGVATDRYRFKLDYFFVMGDNRYHSLDSRLWGFVPESAVIGKVSLLVFSYNQHEPGLSKIRTHRIFKKIN